MFELSDDAIATRPLHLVRFDTRFGNADQVWRTMQADAQWIIVPVGFGFAGDNVVLQGSDGSVRFKVAAHSEPGILNGIIGSHAAMQQFTDAPLGLSLLVEAQPAIDPKTLARTIKRSLFPQVVQAATMREVLDQGYRFNTALLGMYGFYG